MKTLKSILEGWKEDNSDNKKERNNKNFDNHNKFVSKHYNKYNSTQQESIYHYKEGSNINDYLWKSHKGDYRKIPYHEKDEFGYHSEVLDDAMNVHKTPHKMILYSGTRHDPRELMNKEGIVHHPAYLSTSTNRDIAERFSTHNLLPDKGGMRRHHVYKIHVPENQGGIAIPNDDEKYENELVLPRDTNMKYIKTETRGESDVLGNSKKIYHIHHMKVLK